MYFDFSAALVFAGVAALFILAALTAGRLVRPSRPTPGKRSPYECGEESIGFSRVRFHNRFFTVALVFLIFDAEIVVLYPWVMMFQEKGSGLLVFLEILLFLGILAAGFFYIWVKGDLDWLKGPGEVEGNPRSGGA